MRKQGVGGSVELRNGYDVRARLRDIQHGVVERGLSRAYAQRLEAALQRGDAALQHDVRRIADPAVAKPFDLEIEQRSPVLGAVELVCHGLIDRDGRRLGGGIDIVTAVEGDRFAAHAQSDSAVRTDWGQVFSSRPCVANRATPSRSMPNAAQAVCATSSPSRRKPNLPPR